MSETPDVVTAAAEAVRHVDSGDTLTISGLLDILNPEHTLTALEERYLDAGEPEGLTVFTPIRVGGDEGGGIEHVAHEGMLERIVTGAVAPSQENLCSLIEDDAVEAYFLPMGPGTNLVSEIAAGRPGVFTKVGTGTYADPRNGGPKANDATTEDLVHLVEVGGEEHLFYEAFPIDAAILRGTTADARGNVTTERESNDLTLLQMAMATKAGGGTVIAQVKRLTDCTHREPRRVQVPGALVDYVVVDPDQRQIPGSDEYDPTISGETSARLDRMDPPDLSTRQEVILRRALLELDPGDLVNLGVGMGCYLPQVALREGEYDDVTFTTEHGAIGGVPSYPTRFGAHVNPDALIHSTDIFDLYGGGGLDRSFLGFAQIDADTNVNVSRFSGVMRGPGGIIDITHRTPNVYFCGSLTAGGVELSVSDGELAIDEEGEHVKFVDSVDEVTINGEFIAGNGVDVTVITARGVFEFADGGVELVEVAPGVDVEADILAHADFEIAVEAPDEMPPEVFDL